MLARRILAILLVLHIGLLVYTYVPEMGVCDNLTLSASRVVSDENAVGERLSTSAQFNVLSAVEVVLMACVVVACSMRTTDHLPGLVLVLPGLILVGVIAVRMRHTGLFGCAQGDPQCCGNMVCLDATFTSSPSAIGCDRRSTASDQINVYWDRRTTYCMIPEWYTSEAAILCGGLHRSPNTYACYQYGCSAESTAIPYYGVRLVMFNAILFVIVACGA